MKKISLLLFTLFSVFAANAQTQFEMTPENGFTRQIEVAVPGKSASELFKLAKYWVLTNSEVTLGEEKENVSLLFEGKSPGLVALHSLGRIDYDTRYTIKVVFHDDKYTFHIHTLEYFHVGQNRWMDAALNKAKEFYNKKGELKNMYKYYPHIATFFDSLNTKLHLYINAN